MSSKKESTSVTQRRTLSSKLSERLRLSKQAQAPGQEDKLQTLRANLVLEHSAKEKYPPLELQTITASKSVEVGPRSQDIRSGHKRQHHSIQSSKEAEEEAGGSEADPEEDIEGESFKNSLGKKFRLNLTEEVSCMQC